MAKTSSQTLKDIKKAIKDFPKVVQQKEIAHKEKEKTVRSFMKISRSLAKATANRALTESRSATTRFSDRVENYVKYRPSYPIAVLNLLKNELGLEAGQIVADVGSGTGIFTNLLLQRGYEVYAVEPNKEMREVAEHVFKSNRLFHSIDAPAENTKLREGSVDLITAATAFHWFDLEKAKLEFQRILKPSGFAVLLWNVRSDHADPFHKDYEALIQKFATDYKQSKHRDENLENMFHSFFSDGKYVNQSFNNHQDFDFDGLRGRLLSSSYIPTQDHPNFEAMIKALNQLFGKYEHKGKVRINYSTEVYYGKLK